MSNPTTVSSGKSTGDRAPSGVIRVIILVPTDPPSFDDDGTVNPVAVGDSEGGSATPSPLRRLDVCLAVPKDEGGVTMLAPLPVSDGDEDSTLNPC